MTEDEATDLMYSRPVAAAAGLGEHARARIGFEKKHTLLTGETVVLKTANGRSIARSALMLLIRIVRRLDVALPPDCRELEEYLAALAKQLNPDTIITFLKEAPPFERYDAILSVGCEAKPDLPWTVVNSNGWTARVSSCGTHLCGSVAQVNPIGALGAACFGVADVFKRRIALSPEKGELLDGIAFSFWSYTITDNPGPELPLQLSVDLLLAGAGAIGNGTAYLLSCLPLRGSVIIADRQTVADENWGTYLNLTIDDIRREEEKPNVLARLFDSSRILVRKYFGDVSKLSEFLGDRCPKVILNGLDGIPPRHAIQKLWPDLVIDGAIGADFSCQASCHPWGKDVACLLCLFHDNPKAERAVVVQSRASGLPEEVCNRAEALLTIEDVKAAAPDKQDWLSQHIGRQICSVVTDAVKLSLEPQEEDFAPSVPFVACLSSCMIVTELVRYLTTGATLIEPRWQLNLLWAPDLGAAYPQSRDPNCICVQRQASIVRVRAKRALRS